MQLQIVNNVDQKQHVQYPAGLLTHTALIKMSQATVRYVEVVTVCAEVISKHSLHY